MSDGCGKLALCASEENCSRPGSPCWPAGRVAVYLSGGGNSRLDGHGGDQALQGFAAVSRPKIFLPLLKPKSVLLIFLSSPNGGARAPDGPGPGDGHRSCPV